MAKTKDDDASLKRLGGGRWQTRDERFTIEPQSGTWVVVDAEQTDDLGLPLIRGPFGSLGAAKDAIGDARVSGKPVKPLPTPTRASSSAKAPEPGSRAGSGKTAKPESGRGDAGPGIDGSQVIEALEVGAAVGTTLAHRPAARRSATRPGRRSSGSPRPARPIPRA